MTSEHIHKRLSDKVRDNDRAAGRFRSITHLNYTSSTDRAEGLQPHACFGYPYRPPRHAATFGERAGMTRSALRGFVAVCVAACGGASIGLAQGQLNGAAQVHIEAAKKAAAT